MAATEQAVEIDEQKLGAFMGQAVGELGATLGAALVVIGDQLGLYKAMAGAGAITPPSSPTRTGTTERYVREWLNAQAAGGYVTYDPATRTLHAAARAGARARRRGEPGLPLRRVPAVHLARPRRAEDPRGVHAAAPASAGTSTTTTCSRAPSASSAPGYIAHLVDRWIPALDGVEAKLRAGGRVADVGCGLGASTILMAKAFPASQFVGFDYHAESIERARARAADAGVGDRVRFEVAPAKRVPRHGYDLVTMFDCLHDMGDPGRRGAARPRRARATTARG